MKKGYFPQKNFCIDWTSRRSSPDEYQYYHEQERDGKYSHEPRTFEYISEEINNHYRESTTYHAIEESTTIPLMVWEHIHTIAPEEDRETCKEEKKNAREKEWNHLSFFNNLITSEGPSFLYIGVFPSYHCHRESKRIHTDKYEEKSNQIGKELWIENHDTSEYKAEKSEVGHKKSEMLELKNTGMVLWYWSHIREA